jgi:hypothetical protein
MRMVEIKCRMHHTGWVLVLAIIIHHRHYHHLEDQCTINLHNNNNTEVDTDQLIIDT